VDIVQQLRRKTMRFVPAAVASALLTVLASVGLCDEVDWVAFDDPNAFLLTDPLAMSIAELKGKQAETAIQRLHESLKSTEVEIRRRGALTLGKLGDSSGVPVMIADLSKATGRDRDNVVVALRILKDRRAVPALRQALKDESPYVRSIAVAALGEMKATEAYADIVVRTKDKEGRDGNGGKTLDCVRFSPADLACYALGALGDTRAVPVLIDLLRDEDLKVPARQGLEVLTMQKFGDDPDAWAAWWKSQAG
jgi:HEAT repeat protein